MHSAHGIRHPRSLAALVVAFVVAAVLAVAAQPAAAYGTYLHGGITACAVCHLDGHTNWKPVSEVCNTCHPGYRVPSASTTCWACHTPGQDMSGFRTDSVCTSACHLTDGTTSTHLAHADRSTACSTCHPLTVSLTDPGGSPHHTRPLPPAPVITSFLPTSAAIGDLVTLTGDGFTAAYAVSVNGTPATAFDVISATQLTLVVPVGATSGPITVSTVGGTSVSATDLLVATRVAATVTLRTGAASIVLGRAVHLSGVLRPASLGGTAVRLTVRVKMSGEWSTVRTALVNTAPAGAYAWSYRPLRRGRYRLQASVTPTAAHTAARSSWVTLTVR
jgi:hypothetical protein